MKKTFLFFLITIFSQFLSCAKDFPAAKLEPSQGKNCLKINEDVIYRKSGVLRGNP